LGFPTQFANYVKTRRWGEASEKSLQPIASDAQASFSLENCILELECRNLRANQFNFSQVPGAYASGVDAYDSVEGLHVLLR